MPFPSAPLGTHPDAADPQLAEELIAYRRRNLAHFTRPESVSFDTAPRLPSGKLLRRELIRCMV